MSVTGLLGPPPTCPKCGPGWWEGGRANCECGDLWDNPENAEKPDPNQCPARKGGNRCHKLRDLHVEHHDLVMNVRWRDGE